MPSAYTKAQTLEWLSFIGYDVTDEVKEEVETDTFPANLEILRIISRLYMVAVPFENTTLQYDPAHELNIEPQYLFQRFIKEKKGSCCFGKSGLLFEMLRSLGFRVYGGQARVNNTDFTPGATEEKPAFTPPLHIITFVQPNVDNTDTYLLDIGFGGTGLVRPILLEEGAEVFGCTQTEKHRLVRRTFPGRTSAQNMWALDVLRVRPGKPEKWSNVYMFDEAEHFKEDYIHANFYVGKFPFGTPFYGFVVLIKNFFVDKDHEDLGTLLLFGDQVRRNVGSKSEVLRTFKTEKERIAAIKEFFSIELDEDEALSSIKGRASALPM
ncbi:cysteine proteinase [Marasmius fiardii PR-910]|nr:cysteine proteinase [Marasmius fiardii PR-910]